MDTQREALKDWKVDLTSCEKSTLSVRHKSRLDQDWIKRSVVCNASTLTRSLVAKKIKEKVIPVLKNKKKKKLAKLVSEEYTLTKVELEHKDDDVP